MCQPMFVSVKHRQEISLEPREYAWQPTSRALCSATLRLIMVFPLMLPLAFASLVAASAPALASAPAPAAVPAPWVLPNFADRLELDVVNDGDAPVDTLAVVSIAEASQTALRFPGTLAIVVAPGAAGGAPTFLPSQVDDLDGNGTADELVFQIALGAKESRRVHVYYSATLRDELPWPKRVHASHAFGYNRATAALESETIGYRTYGGFFLDVQGRAAGQPGLHNTLLGYVGSRQATSAGRDVIHLGDTLGLGGLFLRSSATQSTANETANGAAVTVARPPLNVPDYAHKPSPPDVPRYRVIASGPLRAIVEARMDRWRLGESEVVSVRATYTITAGAAHVECRFQIVPLRLDRDREYEVGAGVRHLPSMSRDEAPGRIALAGTESAAIGPLALALYYDRAAAGAAPALVTKEASNDIVIFRDRLTPGHAVEGRYQLAAAWSGTGVGVAASDLLPYLRRVEQQARAAVRVVDLQHAKTPHPDQIEGEAH
jgi:hypothetical protein